MASSTLAARGLGADDAIRLVGRDAGRQEQDALEPERLARALGEREMPVVDWIEGAAQDAPGTGFAARLRRQAHGSAPPSSSPAPMRTMSPGSTPARRSSRSMPPRPRSRWKRSADSSLPKSVW